MQRLISCALLATLVTSVRATGAEDAESALDPFEIDPPHLDVTPARLVPLGDDREGTELGIGVTWAKRPEGSDLAGHVTLSIPTDAVLSPRKAKQQASDADDEKDAPPHLDRHPRPSAPLLPRIGSRDARSAIAAALARAGVDEHMGDLDDLSARARWSALLPELRLRATRLLDESSSFSPTSYDPDRTTSSGGASLWLEARVGWRLDRLVFAEEEVRIQRLRDGVADERREVTRLTLAAFFAWQKAAQRARDPFADTASCIDAWLREGELEAELDVTTGGWFARWRARQRPLPEPPCLAEGGADGDDETE